MLKKAFLGYPSPRYTCHWGIDCQIALILGTLSACCFQPRVEIVWLFPINFGLETEPMLMPLPLSWDGDFTKCPAAYLVLEQGGSRGELVGNILLSNSDIIIGPKVFLGWFNPHKYRIYVNTVCLLCKCSFKVLPLPPPPLSLLFSNHKSGPQNLCCVEILELSLLCPVFLVSGWIAFCLERFLNSACRQLT